MDLLSFRRQWRRRKYHRMNAEVGGKRKKVQIVQFGGKRKRAWRVRSIPKLRLELSSPLKLWKKFNNAYTNMMLKLAGNLGGLSDGNGLAGKRIPSARRVAVPFNKSELENRFVYEIYKSLLVAMENSR